MFDGRWSAHAPVFRRLPPGLQQRLPVITCAIRCHGWRRIWMLPLVALGRQLVGDFLFGLADRTPVRSVGAYRYPALCRARRRCGLPAPSAPFFALVSDIGPHSVELSAPQTIVRQQNDFNAFHVLGSQAQLGQDGFFFHALAPTDSSQAVAFGQQGQTFNDYFFRLRITSDRSILSLVCPAIACGVLRPSYATLIDFDPVAGHVGTGVDWNGIDRWAVVAQRVGKGGAAIVG